jgi:rSAM/selenodomain-associated transferase 2
MNAANSMYPRVSIIMPTLNEAPTIAGTLAPLQALRKDGCEIIVADGGSEDDTLSLATPLADRVLQSPRGRARQMNTGAAVARAPLLLFLHADTRLPAAAPDIIFHALSEQDRVWGRFDVRLSGDRLIFRIIERLMNRRSRWTGIATGDQAIFVLREAFFEVGGFADIPLMEDIALSKALKSLSPPINLKENVVTASRRWETQGVWRTILHMWWLRLRYFLGADPAGLARAYDPRANSQSEFKAAPVFQASGTDIVTETNHD